MKKHRVLELPDYAAACLTCACGNPENDPGQHLVRLTKALTSTGVLAAIFLADSAEHVEIVRLARAAITEQRLWCDERTTPTPGHCRGHRSRLHHARRHATLRHP